MAIRTGRDKRITARAHRMTGDHRGRIARHDSKDVPRFAPNFTVYVLPSNVVCLYSEDRKFFLHGQLYCALPR
jgi:ribosomal protein S12 methylthiotransferase accessory factor